MVRARKRPYTSGFLGIGKALKRSHIRTIYFPCAAACWLLLAACGLLLVDSRGREVELAKLKPGNGKRKWKREREKNDDDDTMLLNLNLSLPLPMCPMPHAAWCMVMVHGDGA